MGDVLTIETGLSCNQRCAHCSQPMLRARFSAGAGDLSTTEIQARIVQGLADGAVEVAFTGGEPTIRKDIADLVTFARAHGAARVSLTTNARMFAYPEFCARLLDAGLGGVSVSLHGPDAATHEALTRVGGSFRQTVAGVATLLRTAAARGVRCDVSSITVLVPSNIDRLRETLVLAGGLGARLHIIQPFILSRTMLATADQFMLTRQALRRGIESALADPLPHGGRVKPYNLPHCDYAHLGDVIEFQRYALRTSRQHEDVDAARQSTSQFIRDDACEACDDLRCPGVRIEHLPDTDMAAMILEDVDRAVPPVAGRAVRIGSLDLLGPAAFAQVLGGLRSRGAAEVSLLWGGLGRTPAADVTALCREYGVGEVVLLVRPATHRIHGVQAWEAGNVDEVVAFVGGLGSGTGFRPALFAVVSDLDSARTSELSFSRLLELAGRMADVGGARAYLAVPERVDEAGRIDDPAIRDGIVAQVSVLAKKLAVAGLVPSLVVNAKAPQDPAGVLLQTRAAAYLPAESWDPAFLAHRFAGPAFGWAMWSYPVWVREFPTEDAIITK